MSGQISVYGRLGDAPTARTSPRTQLQAIADTIISARTVRPGGKHRAEQD